MSKTYEVKHSSPVVAKKHIAKIKKRGGKILEKAEIGIPKKTRVKYKF